ncbi:uncharacterized protein LOC144479034 isoform X4 [Augochlora pura]
MVCAPVAVRRRWRRSSPDPREQSAIWIVEEGPGGLRVQFDSSTSKAESADSGVYTCSSPANTAQKIIVHRGWRPATKWPYKLPTEKYPK